MNGISAEPTLKMGICIIFSVDIDECLSVDDFLSVISCA